MKDKYNILVVDDDPYVLDAFQVILDGMENCNFFSAASFSHAKEIIESEIINLAFLDIVLPEIDGYEICKYLKNHHNGHKAYFILMSADKNHLLDRIKAYKVGAQEFLAKPFDLKEAELIIMSKIEFYLQTKDQPIDPTIITSGKFLIDDKTKKVMMGKEEVNLTSMEYNLLKFLLLNPEEFLELDKIITGIWREDNQSSSTADNARHLIGKLRVKIEKDSKNPVYLVNSKRNGYIFYPSGAPTVY
jgi:DNA-binding response OmpR family regulator